MKTIRHHTSSTSNRACSSLSKDNCLTMEAAYEAILRQLHTQGFKSKKTAQQKYAKMPSLVYCTVDQPKSLGRNDRSMLIFPMLKHAETTAEPAKEFLNYS